MGVLLVDAHVGAIGAVAIKGVAENYGAIGGGAHVPAIWVGPVEIQRVVAAISSYYIIHVFGEIVQGIAAGRAAGYAHMQWPGGQPRERGCHTSLVVHGVGKRHCVAYGWSVIDFSLTGRGRLCRCGLKIGGHSWCGLGRFHRRRCGLHRSRGFGEGWFGEGRRFRGSWFFLCRCFYRSRNFGLGSCRQDSKNQREQEGGSSLFHLLIQ